MYAATASATATRQASTRSAGTLSRRRCRPESVLAPLWVFLVILAVLVAAAALPTAAEDTRATSATRRVRVAASDTLWSIATANPVAGLSTTQSVAIMRRLNGLTGTAALQPGAVITVPCAASFASNLAMR